MGVALLVAVVPRVYSQSPDQLQNRYDKISTSVASATTIHSVGFTVGNLAVPIGSISIEFCSNSPIIDDPCIAPVGMNASTATLDSQQGEIGFSVYSATANKIILGRPAVLPAGTPNEYVLNNILNPSTEGSYYAKILTFTSTDGTGSRIEYGGVVFAIVLPITVVTEVPPYLQFCVAVNITQGDCSSAANVFIDLGEFSSTTPVKASSKFMTATNAANGYSITLTGTTLTSGNNQIPPLVPGSLSNPGNSQFGINLRANTNPSVGNDPSSGGSGTVSALYNIPNLFRFQSGDVLVTSPTTSDFQLFTVSYMTNVSTSQAPGYYATTLTYICLANF